MSQRCTHLDHVHAVTPKTPNGCEECLATGSGWVHLRLCLECGHVGCCDDSPNRHATKHFHATTHPVMRSFERGEDWGWCFVDELFMEPAPEATAEPAPKAAAEPAPGATAASAPRTAR